MGYHASMYRVSTFRKESQTHSCLQIVFLCRKLAFLFWASSSRGLSGLSSWPTLLSILALISSWPVFQLTWRTCLASTSKRTDSSQLYPTLVFGLAKSWLLIWLIYCSRRKSWVQLLQEKSWRALVSVGSCVVFVLGSAFLFVFKIILFQLWVLYPQMYLSTCTLYTIIYIVFLLGIGCINDCLLHRESKILQILMLIFMPRA